MASNASAAFALAVFLDDMSDIEVGEPFAMQILQEAVERCASAGITVEELVRFADDQSIARVIIPVTPYQGEER